MYSVNANPTPRPVDYSSHLNCDWSLVNGSYACEYFTKYEDNWNTVSLSQTTDGDVPYNGKLNHLTTITSKHINLSITLRIGTYLGLKANEPKKSFALLSPTIVLTNSICMKFSYKLNTNESVLSVGQMMTTNDGDKDNRRLISFKAETMGYGSWHAVEVSLDSIGKFGEIVFAVIGHGGTEYDVILSKVTAHSGACINPTNAIAEFEREDKNSDDRKANELMERDPKDLAISTIVLIGAIAALVATALCYVTYKYVKRRHYVTDI